MSESLAVSGFGTLVSIGDGGDPTEVFTPVLEIKGISGPNLTTDTIDNTHMLSPEGHKEFIASFKDGGEITFDCNFLPGVGTQADLFTAWAAKAKTNFQLSFPDEDTTVWQVKALITNLGISAPMDDVLGLAVTLKISGAPNFAA